MCLQTTVYATRLFGSSVRPAGVRDLESLASWIPATHRTQNAWISDIVNLGEPILLILLYAYTIYSRKITDKTIKVHETSACVRARRCTPLAQTVFGPYF